MKAITDLMPTLNNGDVVGLTSKQPPKEQAAEVVNKLFHS